MHRTAKYFITFTQKFFAQALAAVSAKLRAILLNKNYKILRFLCCFVNFAHHGQFCVHWAILCKVLCAQNCRNLTFPTHIRQ